MSTLIRVASRLVLVPAVLMALSGTAAFGQMGDAPAATEPAKPAVTISTQVPKLELGDAAPPLAIESWLKGEPVTGFEKGKVYVVEFWATWCGPCKASMPHLSKLQASLKDRGLTIIGVASPAWRDKLDDVKAFVESNSGAEGTMNYTIAWDKLVVEDDAAAPKVEKAAEGEAAPRKRVRGMTNDAYMRAARQRGIPTSFVVGKDGKIAYIGHPMALDVVLDEVMGSKWDVVEGPKRVQNMMDQYEAIYAKAGEDPDATLKMLSEFETKFPSMTDRMSQLKFEVLLNMGKFPEAYAVGSKVVDQAVIERNAQALNQIAWMIVDPESTISNRDIDLAVKAATQAVRLSNEKDAAILDTLAHAQFLKGDKAGAVATQKKAIAALPKDIDAETKDLMDATLRRFESAKD